MDISVRVLMLALAIYVVQYLARLGFQKFGWNFLFGIGLLIGGVWVAVPLLAVFWFGVKL